MVIVNQDKLMLLMLYLLEHPFLCNGREDVLHERDAGTSFSRRGVEFEESKTGPLVDE